MKVPYRFAYYAQYIKSGSLILWKPYSAEGYEPSGKSTSRHFFFTGFAETEYD